MRRRLEPDPKALRALTDEVARFVVEHVASLSGQPASDLEGVEAIRTGLLGPVPETGRPLRAILDELQPAIAKSFNTAGPGYLAFIPGGGVYAAALADFIACAVNRYVGVRQAAPALVQIEETALHWLAVGAVALATSLIVAAEKAVRRRLRTRYQRS